MYTPESFRIDDRATLHAFMRRHNFATFVTHDGASPHATHLPVLLDEARGAHGTLVSHMARANPQWRHFANGEEVLAIFTGPHAYISPAWYVEELNVPTWNYTAVHVYGRPRVVEDEKRFAQMLHDLVEHHEAGREGRWAGSLPPEYRDRVMRGALGVEIEITRIEGKFKLSQNRSPEDVQSVVTALAASADQTERETAEMMRAAAAAGNPA